MQIPSDPNDFGELNEEEEIYKENILDHYKHPHNTGALREYTFRHKELNPLCGDTIEMFVLVDNSENIKHVSFVGHGCAISQAATSMLTDYIKGKSLKEIKEINREKVLELLGIKIGIVRMKCALLCLRTLSKGIDKSCGNYKDDKKGLCR